MVPLPVPEVVASWNQDWSSVTVQLQPEGEVTVKETEPAALETFRKDGVSTTLQAFVACVNVTMTGLQPARFTVISATLGLPETFIA